MWFEAKFVPGCGFQPCRKKSNRRQLDDASCQGRGFSPAILYANGISAPMGATICGLTSSVFMPLGASIYSLRFSRLKPVRIVAQAASLKRSPDTNLPLLQRNPIKISSRILTNIRIHRGTNGRLHPPRNHASTLFIWKVLGPCESTGWNLGETGS
jgi:hypothetical protein